MRLKGVQTKHSSCRKKGIQTGIGREEI